MKKNLIDITEEEVRTICELYNETFLSFSVDSGSWTCIGVTVCIDTISSYESEISIYYDGRITLSRNNGDWGGNEYENINPLKAVDYLRLRGYEFKYEIPIKLERKIKLKQIKT